MKFSFVLEPQISKRNIKKVIDNEYHFVERKIRQIVNDVKALTDKNNTNITVL